MRKLKSELDRDLDREKLEGEFTFCEGCYSCIKPCGRTTKEMWYGSKEAVEREFLRRYRELEAENKELKERVEDLERMIEYLYTGTDGSLDE